MEQDLELSPISIIRLFETTKAARQSFAIQIVERLQDGTANPLETHLQVKCLEDTLKQITDNSIYKSLVLEEAQKNGKTFDFHNAKFETKEVGVKYDFSKCGDLEWDALNDQITMLKEQMKKRETLLKTIPEKGLVITEEDSGDTYTIYPPSKLSTTSVCVTLK